MADRIQDLIQGQVVPSLPPADPRLLQLLGTERQRQKARLAAQDRRPKPQVAEVQGWSRSQGGVIVRQDGKRLVLPTISSGAPVAGDRGRIVGGFYDGPNRTVRGARGPDLPRFKTPKLTLPALQVFTLSSVSQSGTVGDSYSTRVDTDVFVKAGDQVGRLYSASFSIGGAQQPSGIASVGGSGFILYYSATARSATDAITYGPGSPSFWITSDGLNFYFSLFYSVGAGFTYRSPGFISGNGSVRIKVFKVNGFTGAVEDSREWSPSFRKPTASVARFTSYNFQNSFDGDWRKTYSSQIDELLNDDDNPPIPTPVTPPESFGPNNTGLREAGVVVEPFFNNPDPTTGYSYFSSYQGVAKFQEIETDEILREDEINADIGNQSILSKYYRSSFYTDETNSRVIGQDMYLVSAILEE